MAEDELRELVALARRSPREARSLCLDRWPDSEAADLPHLLLALGWADFELGDFRKAQTRLDALFSLADARALGDRQLAVAQLDIAVQSALGRAEAAVIRTSELVADQSLSEATTPSVLAMATAFAAAGHFATAREWFDEVLTRDLTSIERSQALNNRAVAAMEAGDFSVAERDLDEALRFVGETASVSGRAITEHNAAALLARQGRLAEALRHFDKAWRVVGNSNSPWLLAPALLDWAQLLLDAGLLVEAKSAAAQAVLGFARSGANIRSIDAAIVLSRACVAEASWHDALKAVEDGLAVAESAGLSQSRLAGLSSQAQLCRLLAGVQSDGDELHFDRLSHVSVELAIAAGERLRDRGRSGEAVGIYESALDTAGTSAADRLAAGVLRCRLSGLQGAHQETISTGRSVVQAAEVHCRVLGATELRTTARRRLLQVSEEVVHAAVCLGDANAAVDIFELERAVALIPEPGADAIDERLLARTRELVRRLGDPATTTGARRSVAAELAEVEGELASRRRRRLPAPPSAEHVTSITERSVTVHVLPTQDRVIAVVTPIGGRSVLLDLCDRTALASALRAWDLALDASAVRDQLIGAESSNTSGSRSPRASRELVDVDLDSQIETLGRQLGDLFGKLRAETEEVARVVIATDPRVGHLPWSLLLDAAVHEVDSLGAWLQLTEPTAHTGDGLVVLAGPGLQFGEMEATEIAAMYSSPRTLVGDGATAAALRSALPQCTTLHVAAHGFHRTDRPMMTNLQLADGPYTLLELAALGSVPETVVMSACDVGRRHEAAAATLTALLFARGCSTLVAATGATSDRGMALLMVELHRTRLQGSSWAQGLKDALSPLLQRWPSLSRVSVFGR